MRWNQLQILRVAQRALMITALIAVGQGFSSAWAQPGSGTAIGEPFDGRPVRAVNLDGLDRVDPQLVFNNIRTTVGQPYLSRTISQDIRNLTSLNQFRVILPEAEATSDGGVVVTFRFEEWSLATDIQLTGNQSIPDDAIFEVVPIRPGDPLDTYQINRTRELVIALYQSRGFYLAKVDVDSKELAQSNIVLLRVREGPRVRIRTIEFQGNQAFNSRQLRTAVKTKTSIFLLRTGQLDEKQIETDIVAVSDYYKNRGYLDMRVDRQIDLSNDMKEAKLVFLIEEGVRFTMRSVRVEGANRYTRDQLAGLMSIKTGDVYSQDKIEKSRLTVHNAYLHLGYPDVRVNVRAARDPNAAFVDLLLQISEGRFAKTGEIHVTGNDTTRRDVILREIDLRPNRPLDSTKIDEATRRLRGTRLFDEVDITILQPTEEAPDFRDLIVRVREGNTGEFGFGAAVNSDLGLFGTINMTQRNFDIADFPESFSELISGRAFRGAGQTFNINLQPGAEYSSFSVSLTEPYLFGAPNSFRSSFAFQERELESYDESRLGGSLRLARRLGDVWVLSGSTRWQTIDLHNIDSDAPVDVFDVENEHLLTGIGVELNRTTYDNRFRPGRGTHFEVSFEQIGAMGGDFDFSSIQSEYVVYMTIDEDFLGRRSTLSLRTRAGYKFGGTTPLYERFFLGGGSLRGFDYRTVSPKGIRNDTLLVGDDPVGGDWLVFFGAQYEFPIYSTVMNGVFFIDSGTVTNDPGFDEYRVAVGFGLRLNIAQLSQAPIAMDFGFPIMSEAGDEKRLFNFNIDLPIQ